MSRLHSYGLAIAILLATILDRWLKIMAVTRWSEPILFTRWFGWRPFFNSGVAFGLPLPHGLALVFSAIVIIVLLFLLITPKIINHPGLRLAIASIILGATSNFFDRLRLGITIDYLQILTGVFNLADGLILAGFIYLVWSEYKKHRVEYLTNKS